MGIIETAREHGSTTGWQVAAVVFFVLLASRLFGYGWPSAPLFFAYIAVFFAVRSTVYAVTYWAWVFLRIPMPSLDGRSAEQSVDSTEVPVAKPSSPRPQLPARPKPSAAPESKTVVNELTASAVSVSYPLFPYGRDVLITLASLLHENPNLTVSGRVLDRNGVGSRDPRSGDVSSGEIVEWMSANGIVRGVGNNQYIVTDYGDGWASHNLPHPTTAFIE